MAGGESIDDEDGKNGAGGAGSDGNLNEEELIKSKNL